jgi:uncharacterized protein (DUF2252 family)
MPKDATGTTESLKSERDKAYREGRALRKTMPRASHALWKPSMRSGDPLEMLLASSKNRLHHLLPLRYGRMSHSPFTYMRGAAGMMAADVAAGPITGIRVQACGDCHLGNFGAFASPERRVLFDINDFDETLPASWEFDLKRLAVSFVLHCRDQGYDAVSTRDVTAALLAAYRRHVAEYAMTAPLDAWYAIIDSEILIRTAPDEATRQRRIEFESKARRRTADSLIGKLLVEDDGRLRFKDQPPTIAHLPRNARLEKSFHKVLERYPATLPEDRRYLLSRYRLADLALKVVGVGSVGTRCAAALYLSDGGDRLVLQVKEACPSVLAPYAGKGPHAHQGQRVVVGQRLMQCASDIFLGWANDDDGHQYYVRQLRDMKTSVAYDQLKGQVLFNFADMCGWALARAHAKSGDSARLSGYLGSSDRLDRAITDFAQSYADQCEQDFALFKRLIRAGKIPVEIEPRTR